MKSNRKIPPCGPRLRDYLSALGLACLRAAVRPEEPALATLVGVLRLAPKEIDNLKREEAA